VEEESIRDNFVLIYELLDEFMDFGYPQITETKVLQKYITQEGFMLTPQEQVQMTNALTGQVGWRPEGIVHKKNEVFLDVIESVNFLINSNGTVMKSDVTGTLNMRVFLSGRPELRLGLNDKVLFQITGSK
jgi:AP-1 complex subunit mu